MVLSIAAFALGSVPSGYLVGRLHGVDIRQHGSGNVGATNAERVLGKRAGIVVLLFDVLKAVIAASLAPLCETPPGPLVGAESAVLGTLAVLGHYLLPFGLIAGVEVFLP